MFANQLFPKVKNKLFFVLVIFSFIFGQISEVNAAQFPNHNVESFSTTTDTEFLLQSAEAAETFEFEEKQIDTFFIESAQLESKDRQVFIYFPSDYSSNNSSYPVIYVQTAQDLFNLSDLDNGNWVINRELLDFYSADFEQEHIIVGVVSDPVLYWEEHSPWVNEHMYLWVDPYEANRSEGGRGDDYLDFIVNTLKPYIDANYRTLPDQENTAIAGRRTGGLFSIYAVLSRPDIFSKAIALSPSIWFAEGSGSWLSNNRLLDLIENTQIPNNVFFKIGIADDEKLTEDEIRPVINDNSGKEISFPQAYHEGAQAVVEALLDQGLPHEQVNDGVLHFDFQQSENLLLSRDSEKNELAYKYQFPLFYYYGFESLNFTMEPYLNRSRRVWVYLPPNYRTSPSESFPVIYLTDAQHLFGTNIGANVSKDNDWLFDETLDSIYKEYGIGFIAVAVEFDSHFPWDEYLPWNNNYMGHWMGDSNQNFQGVGDKMLDFIINNVKPEIDTRYRTKPEREYTAIGGGSRCGLFALYAGLERPDVFSKVMAFSSAVWLANNSTVFWDNNNGLQKWFNNNNAPTNVRYYQYVGTDEDSRGIGSNYFAGVLMVKDKLTTAGVASSNQKLVRNLGGTHFPRVWSPYVKGALKFLFQF